jgi:hypothetical protein
LNDYNRPIKITAPLPQAVLKALEEAQEDEQRFENLEDLALFLTQRVWEFVAPRLLE